MAYQPKPFEIAGVDLFGRRQSDGSVILGGHPTSNGTPMPDFPQEVEVCGAVYTLEFIKKNKDEAPDVVVPGHPGYDIEWGIYV